MNRSNFAAMLLAAAGLGAGIARAQWEVKESRLPHTSLEQIKRRMPYLVHVIPDREWDASNFAPERDVKRFRDARYGMFIHFGLSTYVKRELSWGTAQRALPDRMTAKPPFPKEVWTSWKDKLTLENFKKEELVEILKSSGMKYVVVIAKHHEGFHWWDTAQSDFKCSNTPWGGDLVKTVSEACREAGVMFGIYWSQRDWYRPDYAPVDPAVVNVTGRPPFYAPKPGMKIRPGKSHAAYKKYQEAAIRELCTKYGKVDIFWFDACWWNGMFTPDMWDSEKLTRMIRGLQPGILINNRASIPGDFDTPEQRIGVFQNYRPWETCATLASGWSYTGTRAKPPLALFRQLQNTAVRDGNLLLSWGMRWDGAWDASQKDALRTIGGWLKGLGDSIYGTRGGPWLPAAWGGATFRGDKIYLHLVNPGAGNAVLLPKLPGFTVTASRDISGLGMKMKETAAGYEVDISGARAARKPAVFELTASRALTLRDVRGAPQDAPEDRTLAEKKFAPAEAVELALPKASLARSVRLESDAPLSGTASLSFSPDGKAWEQIPAVRLDGKGAEIRLTRHEAGAILEGVRAARIRIAFSKPASGTVTCRVSGE